MDRPSKSNWLVARTPHCAAARSTKPACWRTLARQSLLVIPRKVDVAQMARKHGCHDEGGDHRDGRPGRKNLEEDQHDISAARAFSVPIESERRLSFLS